MIVIPQLEFIHSLLKSLNDFVSGINTTIFLVPEEEAGVSPHACRQVAGQYKLPNHVFLATQLLWLVKGKNLVKGSLLHVICYAVLFIITSHKSLTW